MPKPVLSPIRSLPALVLPALVLAAGCGGAAASGAGASAAPALAPDAATASVHGLSMSRPEGWRWIPPDETMAADTILVLQGPFGEDALAPVVEVSRRPLTAADRRRKPSHILTQLMMEMVQLFDGYQMKGEPEDIELAGIPAARVTLDFAESLPDGAEVERSAVYYGLVRGDAIFVVRCLGARDGSNEADLQTIVSSISLEDAPAS